MTYALAGALQGALYNLLQSDAGVTALVGDAVYDAVPDGTLAETYVRLGSEQAMGIGDRLGGGAEHRFGVSVITTAPGFAHAKKVAAAVCDALRDVRPTLSRGRVVDLYFHSAKARRTEGGKARQIDLQFRALLADEQSA
ncbi:DUF3168 domain-containing protein [Sulfitobacter sp. S0837]|uniref:DUF3168 domain-containing protein n=1 Tax=Sulfitobacter maritimus TaxID=2741719 RepID=UPI00158339A3|nr:DUF3168 domain-containing protein [Sulfitobacter maritimus]NUH64578.1 DUF3168 domain-containing protein [Sulfitobacter maritimus]